MGPIRSYSALLDWSPHDFSMILSLIGIDRKLSIQDIDLKKGSKNRAAWKIKLLSEKIKIKTHLGNYFKSKKRYLRIITEEDDKIVYDDSLAFKKKLKINKDYIKIKNESPLDAQLKRFIRLKSVNLNDIKIALKISAIVTEIESKKL